MVELKVLILSFVEGVTEFLPISSTGHMILVNHFLQLSNNKDFVNSFYVIIQLGAILAVISQFFRELNVLKKDNKSEISLWIKIVIASIPAGIFGLLFDDYIENKFFNAYVVSFTLIFYGIILLIVERNLKNKKTEINSLENITYKDAFIIGVCQTLALIPGTSRSLTTILSALILGFNREIATKFSFFLAIPIMVGSSLLKLLKIGNINMHEFLMIALGFVLSYIFAKIFINLLMKYIKTHNFNMFGIYRIVLGIIVLGVLW